MTAATLDAGALAADAEKPRQAPFFTQIWRKRGVFALTFLATCLLVLVALLLMPVIYVATGSVIVGDREPLTGANSPAWEQKLGDPADMESNLLLIRSPRLLRLLLTEPAIGSVLLADCQGAARQPLARLRPFDCSRLEGDIAAQLLWLQDRFTVSAVGRSRVIQVAYKSAVPDAAQALANGLIGQFLEDQHAKLVRSRDSALEWVRQRVEQLDVELRRDEAAIEDFRNAHGLVRGSAGPLSSEQLTAAAQQLAQAKAAEADAAQRVHELAGGAGSSPQVLDSRTVDALKQQLATASAQVASAAQHLGPHHPQFLALRRQESELSARLGAETGRVADSARRNVEAAHARVVAMSAELARRTEAASQAAESETQIASMVRDLEIKRGSYVDLSRRMSQLETERRTLEASTQLVNMAELPTRPAFPQRLPFMAGGFTLAGVLATAAALVSYRPVSSGALALGGSFTRVPILAQIPGLRLPRTSAREVLGRSRGLPLALALRQLETHLPLQEAVRVLHARLALAGFGTRRRTLMIASEVAGEGKSFLTMALAQFAAASGRRVLVVETDLRRPCLASALGGPPTPGLRGYLEGAVLDVVGLPGFPGIDVLLAGRPSWTSTELFAGSRLPELLEWTKRYDLVLLDSAPVGLLMDGALLASLVDGVLFCLRAGRPASVEPLNTLPDLQRVNGNVVGLAVTFVPDERRPLNRLGKSPRMFLAAPLRAHEPA